MRLEIKMLKKFIEKIWKVSPQMFRSHFVRLTQKTFTVSVGAVVVNDEGKILLLEHLLRPGSGWGIPGGFINENEQPAEAVKREICEEIGLEVESIKLVYVRTTNRHVEILVRARGRGEGKAQNFEIKKVGWFDLNEMPREMHRSQNEIIRKVLADKDDGIWTPDADD
jgi:ADP-ribose pyrophosphatase YjhB (NUDIX family)